MARIDRENRRDEKILKEYFMRKKYSLFKKVFLFVLALIIVFAIYLIWWSSDFEKYVQYMNTIMLHWFTFDQLVKFENDFVNLFETSVTSNFGEVNQAYLNIYHDMNLQKKILFIVAIVAPLAIIVIYWVIKKFLFLLKMTYYFYWHLRYEYEPDLVGDVVVYAGPDLVLNNEQVDLLLKKRTKSLIDYSLEKLGLNDRDLLLKEPIVIKAPILWRKGGANLKNKDIHWRIGADKKARYGVYRIVIIHLTETYLGIFSCYYNFIKNKVLHVESKNHEYEKIMSIAFAEFGDDEDLHLRSGKSINRRYQFRIVFDGGEKITITTNAKDIEQEVGINNTLPDNDAEQAVKTLERFLKSRRGISVKATGGKKSENGSDNSPFGYFRSFLSRFTKLQDERNK